MGLSPRGILRRSRCSIQWDRDQRWQHRLRCRNTATGSGLVETSSDIGLQGVFHVLVGVREVKPFRVEVTAAPLFHVGVLWIVAVGHDGQEPLVAVDAADIFRGTRAGARDAGAHLGRDVQSEQLLDLDGMTPTIAEIVEVTERRDFAAAEVAQTHFALVEQARAIRKITFVNLNITIPQAADVEFVQVAVPPVEGGLDREMKLPQMPDPRNDELSPDRRLDLEQGDPDLERIGFLVKHGMK